MPVRPWCLPGSPEPNRAVTSPGSSPVEVVTEILVGVARRRATITYGELLHEVEGASPEVLGSLRTELAPVLRAASVAADEAGHGLLTAVVVRESSGLPGGGFFRLATERGRSGDDPHQLWSAELARVYSAYSDRA